MDAVADLLRIVDPATGDLLREVPAHDAAAVAAAAQRARAAQPGWAATPLAQRRAVIASFRDLLAAGAEAASRLLCGEMGKPIVQARAELAACAERIDFFLARVEPVIAERVVLDDARRGLREAITHEPLGVVVAISAWNYPWFVGLNVVIPALLTGNAVLYKPSEHATLTGLLLGELLHAAGVPEAVFQVVVGAGATGAQLLAQPVDGVYFTGSHATGRRIAESVAARLVRVQLELGGKDPVYVCADADAGRAAASLAEGAFYNAGQSCCAVERIYVQRALAAPFTEALVAAVDALVIGDPRDERTTLGPLARPGHLAVLERQVCDALARGGRLLRGGWRLARPGSFFLPTVVAGADAGMELMVEETFGPLIGIQVVDDDEQAVALMNASRYGLTAGVYTPDRARALGILARMRAGSAYWNCCDRVSPRLPWSGRGDSGIGCTLSDTGIAAFTQPKAWHLREPA